jgi:hypothetical protein
MGRSMTDYVWFPVSGNGQTSATPYVWNAGALSWNSASYWVQGFALDFVTYPPTPGDVPGSGSGASAGPGQDNVYLYAGDISSVVFSFYHANPPSQPYIATHSFPVDVVIDSGTVDIDNLTLAAFNQYAFGDPLQFPVLSVQGAALEIRGNISSTGSLVFPTINFLGSNYGGNLPASGGGTIDLSAGAYVLAAGSVQANINFDFLDGAGDLLALGGVSAGNPAAFGGAIKGFAIGDAIDLTQVKYTGETPPSLDPTSHVLTVTEGGQSYSLQFDAGVAGDPFIATPDASGNGTLIQIACFCAGTLIATPDGATPVERLRAGDLVLTPDGAAKPVRWLGRSTVSTRFADPVRAFPIRIRAGALAEGVPARDLLLSPDHAVFVDNVLIHAAALVNGASIARDARAPAIIGYYHVELDDHALILAENVPAETFVDNVDRMAFDNWREYRALYPRGRPVAEMPYPRAKARRQIPALTRARIDDRARQIGFPLTAAA